MEVRAAVREGFDRFVLEFAGAGVPAFRAEYIDEGTIALVAAPGILQSEAGSYAGPRRIELGSTLRSGELAETADGIIQWNLAVDATRGFETFTLVEPSRLVIDISQH